MQISSWVLYWLLKLDAIQGSSIALFVISCVGLFIMLLAFLMSYEPSNNDGPAFRKILTKYATWNGVISSVLLVIMTLIPNTKQAAIIWGLPQIVNSKIVQEDLPQEAKQVYGLAKEWLKEQVEAEKKEKGNE